MPEPDNGPTGGSPEGSPGRDPDLTSDASGGATTGAPPEVPAVVRRYLDEHIDEVLQDRLRVLAPARINPWLPAVVAAAVALALALVVLLPRTGRLGDLGEGVATAGEGITTLSGELDSTREELAASAARLTDLERTSAQTATALEELATGAAEVERLRADLAETQAQLDEVAEVRAQLDELREVQAQLDELERRLAELSTELERRADAAAEPVQGAARDEPGETEESEETEADPAPSPAGAPAGEGALPGDDAPATPPADGAWRSLGLESGWQPLASGDAPPEFRLDDGALELRGRAEATTDGSQEERVLRLPPACRPADTVFFQTDADDGRRAATALVMIDEEGELLLESLLDGDGLGRDGWIALDGIRIELADPAACRL